MGVKDLWTILEPVCEQCSLSDLQGKTVAVDISGWIFQARECQQLAGRDSLKPHLRVLFWRLHHLVRNQIRPVIVFDGPTVHLKKVSIERRNSRIPSNDKFLKESESKFRRWTSECKGMLDKFKIPYIESNGDAEAACAQLNESGEVDGCISDDSDCFLFGAKVVYTHFSCDESKVESMRCYRMSRIREQIGVDRRKLVALALLLGCDYGLDGVKGIGKEQSMRLINGWKDVDPLQRMESWRTDADIDRLTSFETKKPEHCRRCRHLGTLTQHKQSGCSLCATSLAATSVMHQVGSSAMVPSLAAAAGCVVKDDSEKCSCDWHNMQAVYQSRLAEVKISSAALKDPLFPNNDIISAYLNPAAIPPHKPFKWLRPTYTEVEEWIESVFSSWNKGKVRTVLLPYFTAHDMHTLVDNPTMDSLDSASRPERIKSRGKKHGRQLYEVIWKSVDEIPNPDNESESLISWEFKDIFCAAFPGVAAKHEEWLSDKEDTPKGKKRKLTEEDLPASQSTIKDFFRARKRLNFDSVAKSSSPNHTVSAPDDSDLIVLPECQ